MWWCTKIDKCEVSLDKWTQQLQLTRRMFMFHWALSNSFILDECIVSIELMDTMLKFTYAIAQIHQDKYDCSSGCTAHAQWPCDSVKVVQGRSDPAHSLIWLLCTPPSSLSSYNHFDLLSRVQHAAPQVPSKGCECLEMWNWIMMPLPFSWLKTVFFRQKSPDQSALLVAYLI